MSERAHEDAAPLSGEVQLLTFAALSLGVVALAAGPAISEPAPFRPFFGSFHPLLVVAGAAVLGGLSLALLQSGGWFQVIGGKASLRGVAVSAGLATLLAIGGVIGDLLVRYPEDINILPPQAFWFYPTVGFVAEVVFHLFPLALLLLGVVPRIRELGRPLSLWLSVVIAALVEPAFQLAFMDEPFSWAGAHTCIQVFAVNIGQLCVFARYDFASMFSFRMFYYAHWHIAWGVLRLHLLF